MKKGLKALSLMLLATLGITTSGCAIKKSDINTITEKVHETEFNYAETFELTIVARETQEISEDETQVELTKATYTYNEETMEYVFTTETFGGLDAGDNALLEEKSSNVDKIYMKNNVAYVKTGDLPEVKTNYATTTAALENLSVLIEAGNFTLDYLDIMTKLYSGLSDTIYYGCSTAKTNAEKNTQLEDVPDLMQTQKSSFTCDAKRKLFSKTKTFETSYRVSILQLRDLDISINGDYKVTSALMNDVTSPGAGKALKYKTTEITFKY